MKCYKKPVVGEDLEINTSQLIHNIKNMPPYYEYPNEPKDPIDNMDRCAKTMAGRTQTDKQNKKEYSTSYFRHPTEEENKYIRDYLDSISIPTGFNIFEFLDDVHSAADNIPPYYEDTTGRTQTNDTSFDNVNHPAHYNTGKYESIDVMVETQGVDAVKNFCICNAFKYIYRHRFKNGVEDIKKAIWYLNKYVELEEGE